jgi:hypothetical protein
VYEGFHIEEQHICQTKIMNVNTKIEINPFYAGFNTFKVTFTDAAGKPYTKVSSAEIVFNNAADITNEVANLQKIRPGENTGWITKASLTQFAISIGIKDIKDFSQCLDSGKYAALHEVLVLQRHLALS